MVQVMDNFFGVCDFAGSNGTPFKISIGKICRALEKNLVKVIHNAKVCSSVTDNRKTRFI
jgi:hypothetical protein